MAAQVSRMQVNAAIEHLISGKEEGWIEAADIVASFGKTIPSGRWHTITIATGSSDRDAVSGYAAGVGNVQLEQGGKRQRQEKHRGQTVERVGYYHVFHNAESAALSIRHYRDEAVWRSAENNEEPLPMFVLFYDCRGGQSHTFVQLVWERSAPTLSMRLSLLLAVFLQWLQGRRLLSSTSQVFCSENSKIILTARPDLNPGDIVPHTALIGPA